jgi:CO dehydrogenase nickel-insertion accessory protein CooC1
MFDEESERYLQETGEIFLGKIDYDKRVEEYNLRGESLRKLPEDSPACRSVRKILEKAGLV